MSPYSERVIIDYLNICTFIVYHKTLNEQTPNKLIDLYINLHIINTS